MTMIVGLLAAGLLLAAAWVAGLFKRSGFDIAPALRQLLIEKSEGRITDEEFQQREQALHDMLLSQAKPKRFEPTAMRRAVPLAVLGLALAIYAFVGGRPQEDAKLSPAMAIVASGIGDKLSAQGPGRLPVPSEATGEAQKGGDLNDLVKGLANKMEKDPKNGDGWLLLARTYGELHQYANAAKAYEKADALLPADSQTLADWTDAYVMANDRKWDERARNLVKRALKADPKHPKALSLAGSEAFERQQYKQAIEYWTRLKNVEPGDSMMAKLADANINEAQAQLSGKKPADTAPPALGAAAQLEGAITLDSKLKGKFAPTDTVFLIVKAADGSNPPLAAKRFQVADLPLQFKLDESDAMMPGRSIANFPEVLVSARISKSGQTSAQAGDITSNLVRTKAGSQDIKLELK